MHDVLFKILTETIVTAVIGYKVCILNVRIRYQVRIIIVVIINPLKLQPYARILDIWRGAKYQFAKCPKVVISHHYDIVEIFSMHCIAILKITSPIGGKK